MTTSEPFRSQWGVASDTCIHCGEPVHEDEWALWHHSVDDAVTCSVDPPRAATPRSGRGPRTDAGRFRRHLLNHSSAHLRRVERTTDDDMAALHAELYPDCDWDPPT